MTYDTLIVEPIREMSSLVMGFLPALLTSFGLLFVGYLLARVLEQFMQTICKTIQLDPFLEKVGLTKILETGKITRKPSFLLSRVVYLLTMVTVLIMSVKALGITTMSDVMDRVLAYLPNVITGVFILIIGMLIAKIVSAIVFVTAKNTDMPSADVLSHLSKLAIVAYVTIMFLREIGVMVLFEGPHYTIFIGGIVFALALAFGLAGRNIAAKYLDVFKK